MMMPDDIAEILHACESVRVDYRRAAPARLDSYPVASGFLQLLALWRAAESRFDARDSGEYWPTWVDVD